MATYKQIEERAEAAYENGLREGKPYRQRVKLYTQFLMTRRIQLVGVAETQVFWACLCDTVRAFAAIIKAMGYYVIALPMLMLFLLTAPVSMIIVDMILAHRWEAEAEQDEWADDWIGAEAPESEDHPDAPIRLPRQTSFQEPVIQ